LAKHSLIVLPDDTAKPILDLIAGASASLRVKMFVFSDPALIKAVIDAHKRGVKTQVMLNPVRRSGQRENRATRKQLERAGVQVKDSNPAFDVTHEKSAVVDGETAIVMSLNWEPKNLTQTRDYAIVTTNRREVAEIAGCFDADWHRLKFDPGEDARLVWCNLNGRNRVARFIDRAKHSLFLQNERYQDEVIIERLLRAMQRGVQVHVLARPAHTLKLGKLIEGVEGLRILKDMGAKVHKLRGLKLHAKLAMADGKRCIIGSINLAPGSFDSRRELAIEVKAKSVMKRLRRIVARDWKSSRPLDLSDAGLLKDLKDEADEAAAMLALDKGKIAAKGGSKGGRRGGKQGKRKTAKRAS
jgi:phosphatidylserine/phosphatidylglycerophosphate/cardiolipin synthase-like enzyme